MAELTNEDLFDIFTASQAMRESARSVEFAQLTLETVKEEALEYIGGDGGKDGKPPGKLEQLEILKTRMSDLVKNAKSRESGT